MSKKEKYWYVPWIAVAIGALILGAIGRSLALNHSGDTGTANLTFFIVVISAIFLYIVFVAFGDSLHQAIKKKKQPEEIVEMIENKEEVIPPQQQQEDEPKVDVDKIKRDADTQYRERRKAKVALFKKYAHIAVGPHITADELQRLDEYIECYANDESMPDDHKSINPEKLSNPDFSFAILFI